jgi:anti-sigma28 factor (negative regulator of flagellin synthesis)
MSDFARGGHGVSRSERRGSKEPGKGSSPGSQGSIRRSEGQSHRLPEEASLTIFRGDPDQTSEGRVAELRSAIEAGTYAVGGEEIAAAMLSDPAVKVFLSGGWDE